MQAGTFGKESKIISKSSNLNPTLQRLKEAISKKKKVKQIEYMLYKLKYQF